MNSWRCGVGWLENHLLSVVLPPSTRGTLLPPPVSSRMGICVCVPAGHLVLCKMSVGHLVLCKMSVRHLVHKTFSPYQRSLKFFPIQNILERVWSMPKGFRQDQISRTFCLHGHLGQNQMSANCVCRKAGTI